jgi:hypothetical protein
MPRKSQARLMFTSRWIRWAICRQLCQWAPSLGRALNFPLHASFAGGFADQVLEDETQELAFAAEDLDRAKAVLLPAMANDCGDTSTFPSGRSELRSLLFRIDHCIVSGHTMMVLDRTGGTVLALGSGPANWNEAKPKLLKRRAAPDGAFFTLTCNGHFYHFFANDVVPLLYYLRRHGPDIGLLHIVTRPDFPPFVQDTLRAICAAHDNVRILELDRTERLVDVPALWLSRYADTREWMPVTRAQADELGVMLAAYHQLPDAGEPDRLLFVSRGSTRLRRLENEAELMAELMEFGFEFFVPKADDHKAQIETFRSARIVVAVHGAALTNLLFCRPGTLVVELFPANHVKSTYCWLANRLGLRYRAVTGLSGDYLQGFPIKVRDVLAEVEAELENHDSASIP